MTDDWRLTPPRASRLVVHMRTLVFHRFAESGYSTAAFPYVMHLNVYDPALNTWAALTPSSLGRAYADAAVINGKLYVVGGCTNNSDCSFVTNALEVYDPGTNAWSTLAPMP